MPGSAPSRETGAMSDDYRAVTQQLKTYFNGLYYSDAVLLRRVLHPEARYVTATGDDLVNIGMEEYLPIIETRVSPASRGEERRDEIVSIDFAGPKTAFAKVHCAVGERYFTDFLTFIKVEGRWQIISKVFHYDIVDAKQDDANRGSAACHT